MSATLIDDAFEGTQFYRKFLSQIKIERLFYCVLDSISQYRQHIPTV